VVDEEEYGVEMLTFLSWKYFLVVHVQSHLLLSTLISISDADTAHTKTYYFLHHAYSSPQCRHGRLFLLMNSRLYDD
jgi:hypothetical protein